MRSPAAAFAWEFRRRHAWGLAALAGYLILLAGIRLVILASEQRGAFDSSGPFALVVIVPLATTFMTFLAVFSYGLEGDLAARRSIYPARLFTLPVTNTELVGWPMLYGALAMASVWWATRWLAPWPADFTIPWLWPACFAVVVLAWTQALTWLAYPWKGLRVILIVGWMTIVVSVVLLAVHLGAGESTMLGLLTPHLPVSFLVARQAVAGARRGAIPRWRGVPRPRPNRDAPAPGPHAPKHWSSPRRAQAWFEWRRYGRTLPLLVAMVLPFELSLLFLFADTPSLVLATLAAVLLTPPLFAIFVAAAVRTSSADHHDAYQLGPFLATRPLSDAALITAKLDATIRSTLVTWVPLLVVVSFTLYLSGTTEVVGDLARRLVEIVGMPRTVIFGLLTLGGLVVTTWKQLVQSLYLGLSGHAGWVKGSVFATLAALTVLVPGARWLLLHDTALLRLWQATPWILATLAVAKLVAAGWIALRLHEHRLLDERTLILGASIWTAITLALHALLVWLVPAILVPAHLLALLAFLAVPLVRLGATPLALARNRHR